MEASIGIMAYNEEKNIGNLLRELLKQRLSFVKEIIVVNDGSEDKTAEEVKPFLKTKKVKLVSLKKRSGKVNAINKFLKKTKSEIVILESADTMPKEGAIQALINEFQDPEIGIASSRIMPLNRKEGFANVFGLFIYQLHHEVSLKNPKFGEMIAFRNVIKKLPMTAVDEEYLAMLIKEKGYKLKYCPEAIVYNKQPTSMKELIIQRRRIHAGHIDLNRKGYAPATYRLKNIITPLIRNLRVKELHFISGAIMLEAYTRWLGFYDTHIKKDSHYIWQTVRSTKKLIE